jgi:predicted nicotinamide N-methyase
MTASPDPQSAIRNPQSAIDAARDRRLARLRGRLAAGLALKEVPVAIPRAGRGYTILAPADQDRLLDEAESDPEQHLPYWAEIWPSGIALADVALARAEELAGRPVLELGSGLGVTAAAALEAGAELLAADYSAVSLGLCRYNALRNAGREPRTIAINWRAPSAELLARADAVRGFPLLLAADVLYETRDIAPLLALAPRLLAPGGALWLAEPGREAARRFLAAAAELGWAGEHDEHAGPWVDGTAVRVGLHFLRRPA